METKGISPIPVDDIDYNLYGKVPADILAKLKEKVPMGILSKKGLLNDDEIREHLRSIIENRHKGYSHSEACYWEGYVDGILEALDD